LADAIRGPAPYMEVSYHNLKIVSSNLCDTTLIMGKYSVKDVVPVIASRSSGEAI